LKAVFKNRAFRWFLFSFLLYWLSLTFIQLGIGFYTTLLFGLDKSMAFTFSLLSFVCSFLLYWPVNALTKKLGKRLMMQAAYGLFACIFLVTAFVPELPFPKAGILYALGVAAAAPLAVFGILPNAIVGDEAEQAHLQSGSQHTAMYFGLTAFTMKIGISFANLIFPSLLLLGKSTENPLGVRATALAAMAFCLAGWWAFGKYVRK
jgi:Na+/melibiose symporter-like transporter